MKKNLLFAAIISVAFSANAQTVTTISGTGDAGYSASNLTNIADAQYDMPYMGVMDSKGNIWVTDQNNNYIIMLNKSTGKYMIRGGDINGGFADGSGAGGSKFAYPSGMVIGARDTIYIADTDNNAIRRMNPYTSPGSGQMVTTLAGGGPKTGNNGDEGYINAKGAEARFRKPSGVAISADKTYLLVTDKENHVIRKVSISGATYGEVTLFAGTPGEAANTDGSYTTAKFNSPEGITIDEKTGAVYVVDVDGGIRKLLNGNVTTVLATDKIDAATSVAYVEPFLYLGNGCNIKRFNTLTSSVMIFAGNDNSMGDPCGFADGTSSGAKFDGITGISLSPDKTHLIVSDGLNNRIRKVTVPGEINSITETSNAEDIYNVYPNPAQNYFVLQAKNENAFGRNTVELFDVTGRLFLSTQLNFNGQPQRINMQNAKPGLYILKTTSASGAVHTARIIVSQ